MARYARLLLTAVAAAAPVLVLVTPAQAATDAALWHMEDPTVMTDASPNNNTGNPVGVTSVPGTSGSGYHFDKTDRVTVNDSPSLKPGTADFSVTVHVRFDVAPSAAVGDYDLIRKGVTTTSGGEWKIEIFPGNNLASPAFCLFKDTAGKVANLRGTKNLADNAWHTITCAKTASSIKLTVDGATQTKAASLGSISNNADLSIGQKLGGGDQYVGDMDEVRITTGTETGGDTTPPTVVTTLPLDSESLIDSVRNDFDESVVQLREARLEQRRKDTPAARARVRACLGRVDAVLDMRNDVAHVHR